MELRPGYKLTEVGVIPESWNFSYIADKTTKIGSGITPTGGEKVYKREGRPFLRSQNVGWGQLLLDDIAFIDELTHETFIGTEIEAGDVFLNITGASIGRSAVADARVGCGNVNQHVCIIRTIKSQLDPYFLNYFLLSESGQRQIDSFQTGGNRQGLNFEQIRSFQLPIPHFSEQRAISAALSDIDDLIAGLDQLIAKKRDLKQAAMQQLLTGQTRLPGFSGDWKVKRLGDLLKDRPNYGINAPAVPYTDRLPVYLRITDITEDGRFSTQSPVSVNNPNATQYYLSTGDLVFARTGASVGKSYLYNPDDGPLVFAGFLIRVRPDTSLLVSSFLAAFVKTDQYWAWVRVNSMRSGQPGINGNEFAMLPILLPPVEEQTAIAAALSDMDADLAALETRRDKTRDLKQGMMQELLTGRIRLI